MKIRKMALWVAAAAFAFFGMTPVTAHAGSDSLDGITVSSYTTRAADGLVEATVSISGNPGIAVLGFGVNYDTSAYSFVTYEYGPGYDTGDNVNIDAGEPGLVLYNLESEFGYDEDGALVTLIFSPLSADTPDTYISINDLITVDDYDEDDYEGEDEEEADSSSASSTGKKDKDDKTGTSTAKPSSTSKSASTAKPAASTGTKKVDRSYKTADGLGKELFLVIALGAGACAVGAYALSSRRRGQH